MYYISKNKNSILVILAALVIVISIIGLVVSARSKSYASTNKNDSYAMEEENKTIDENSGNKKKTKSKLEDLIEEDNQDDEGQEELNEEISNSNVITYDENGNRIITIYLGEASNYEIINNSSSTTRKNVRSLKDNAEAIKKSEKIIGLLRNDNNNYYQDDYSDILTNEVPINYAYDTNQSNVIAEVTNDANQRVDNSNYTGVDYSGYYLMVNCTANVVNVYEVDREGNILDCVKAFTCSTGDATPKSGTYKTDYKFRWQPLFGNVYGQYATRIVGNILFHSVPYTENRNNGSLEYWEYDKLGTSASMGCVRLTVEDAKWIYDNCKSGTFVEFYEDENPGPLGKPETMKISGYQGLRDWDPTDPDDNNPWNL